jgi:hypothetical protein
LVSSGISLPLGSHVSCPDFTVLQTTIRETCLY